ncbi:MAG: ATP-binding protein, partial [bacterium]
LLDLTSIQSGKLPVSKSDCDSREILGEVVDLMTVTARLKGLDLRCEIDARVPQTIHTDPLRLRQALVNLLGNATKFTDTGSVTVRVAPAGKGRLLRFDIEDTGPGIADDQIERIFEPFVLGDMSTTRTHEGTGLGDRSVGPTPACLLLRGRRLVVGAESLRCPSSHPTRARV